jgi:predicted membrane protein
MNGRNAFKYIFILLLSMFFFIFGMDILIRSFKMTNPLEFVMTLFSASFIILFSAVGVLYVYFRFFRNKSDEANKREDADII